MTATVFQLGRELKRFVFLVKLNIFLASSFDILKKRIASSNFALLYDCLKGIS